MIRALVSCLVVLLGCTAGADQRAEALYQQWEARLKAAQSLTGSIEVQIGGGKRLFILKLLRPNYCQMVSKERAYYGDGKTFWTYYPKVNQYVSAPAQETGMNLPYLLGLEAFTAPGRRLYQAGDVTVQRFANVQCNAITLKRDKKLYVLYLHVRTNLPVGWETKDGSQRVTCVYRDLRFDTPLKPENFAWQPPPDASEYLHPKPDKGAGSN